MNTIRNTYDTSKYDNVYARNVYNNAITDAIVTVRNADCAGQCITDYVVAELERMRKK